MPVPAWRMDQPVSDSVLGVGCVWAGSSRVWKDTDAERRGIRVLEAAARSSDTDADKEERDLLTQTRYVYPLTRRYAAPFVQQIFEILLSRTERSVQRRGGMDGRDEDKDEDARKESKPEI